MRVHIINPSQSSFGIAVITPRWLYVLAEATPRKFGKPLIIDETLTHVDPLTIEPGDVVGVGIHTETRCVVTSLAGWHASAARTSCSAASTPLCFQKRLSSTGEHRR
ncbi:MAG: hypothetical protein R2748_00740 [Bryobacterales bacterium]